MVVTVVGHDGGASGGGFGEHGGGCPPGWRACVAPPGPALHAASTTTATATTAGNAAIDRLQPRQVRTGGRLVVAAVAPRRDDQLIAIPSLSLPARRTNPSATSVAMPDATVPALGGHRARERIPAPAKRCTRPARSSERMSPARPGLRVTR